MVNNARERDFSSFPPVRRVKKNLSCAVAVFLRGTANQRDMWRRLFAHARLSSRLQTPLHESVVVLGNTHVIGPGRVRFGKNVLLYPHLYLETQMDGSIEVGDNVVISSGVHLVSMLKITIGQGTMIGEYASIRDANHARSPGVAFRDAGYRSRPITIGTEVWIGRGAAILAGVTIGDGATVGANAVVTRDVPAGATVVGAPARPAHSRKSPEASRGSRVIELDPSRNTGIHAQGHSELSSSSRVEIEVKSRPRILVIECHNLR
jgi:acetyltransferase-like isoleucine patch superfamily enzyme